MRDTADEYGFGRHVPRVLREEFGPMGFDGGRKKEECPHPTKALAVKGDRLYCLSCEGYWRLNERERNFYTRELRVRVYE